MIAFIKKLPIKAKIILFIMIISIISILLVGLVVVIYDNYRARKDLVNDTTLLAQIIANRSTAALTFNESRLAQETDGFLIKKEMCLPHMADIIHTP